MTKLVGEHDRAEMEIIKTKWLTASSRDMVHASHAATFALDEASPGQARRVVEHLTSDRIDRIERHFQEVIADWRLLGDVAEPELLARQLRANGFVAVLRRLLAAATSTAGFHEEGSLD
jgi:hypothetical protein